VVKRIKSVEDANFESYTNDDYNKFELVDFRTLRYQKKETQVENEIVSAFENSDNQ